MYRQSVKAAAEMQSCFRVLSIARIDAGDRPHVPRAPIQNRFDVWNSRRRSAPVSVSFLSCVSGEKRESEFHTPPLPGLQAYFRNSGGRTAASLEPDSP